MAVWYEVEHSEKSTHNFMECNWHFHDFTIEQQITQVFLKNNEIFTNLAEKSN